MPLVKIFSRSFFQQKVWFCFWVLSLLIVAFGQPAWSLPLSFLASFMGYALFWRVIERIKSKKIRFWQGFLFFSLAEAVHLSWMTATEYHGFYIILVYVCLLFWFGAQFGLFCTLFTKEMALLKIAALSGLWVLLEYSRLFVFCGFAFNPVGLSLSSYFIFATPAAVFGIYGLSFLVIFLNLLLYRVLLSAKSKEIKDYLLGFILFSACGVCYQGFHQKKMERFNKSLDVALIQPGLKPEQKIPLLGKEEAFIPLFYQWRNIFELLEEKKIKQVDLMLFPEAVLPFPAKEYLFDLEDVEYILRTLENQDYKKYFPDLIEPFAQKNEEGRWLVSHCFWLQVLANKYKCDVIAGLEDYEKELGRSYNAAFFFSEKNKKQVERYEKRKLVPLGEYLPLKSLETLVAKYGIGGFAEHGKGAKVFSGKVRFSPSICYEECFSDLMKEGKKIGAELYVNLTNDGWYYPSKLPEQHLYHARVRAIENGVALIRACNTGVTAGIDSLGRIVDSLKDLNNKHEDLQGVLVFPLNYYHYPTLYTKLGDSLILFFSFGFILIYVLLDKRFKILASQKNERKNIPS